MVIHSRALPERGKRTVGTVCHISFLFLLVYFGYSSFPTSYTFTSIFTFLLPPLQLLLRPESHSVISYYIANEVSGFF